MCCIAKAKYFGETAVAKALSIEESYILDVDIVYEGEALLNLGRTRRRWLFSKIWHSILTKALNCLWTLHRCSMVTTLQSCFHFLKGVELYPDNSDLLESWLCV